MRVLQIINGLGTGGAEKLLVETIPYYNTEDICTEILLLNGNRHPFYNQLEDASVKIHSLGTGSLYNPLYIFKIGRYFKNFDIIHVHLFPAFYWVAISKMLYKTNAKFVFTEHNTTNNRRGPIFKCLERIIYNQYAKIITISTDVNKTLLAHLNFPKARFVQIENGVSLKKIDRATKIVAPFFNDSTEDKLLLQVSRFYDQKDQKTVIKAMKLLPNYVKLLFVGDGKNKKDMIQLMGDLNLEDRILFLGEREDVPSLLKTADIIVLSSKFEGLSLSSIEGMASGKPFIASDVPGLTPVVQGAGILFPLGDEQKLAYEIMKLLNDKDYYLEVAEKCKDRASLYDISNMIKKHLKLYNQLMVQE